MGEFGRGNNTTSVQCLGLQMTDTNEKLQNMGTKINQCITYLTKIV